MENKEKLTEDRGDKLASEIIAESEKRWFKAFLIAMALAIFLFVVAAGTNLHWIHVFNSYEYVSQDGSGINSINTGNQENIGYESNGETEKERQE